MEDKTGPGAGLGAAEAEGAPAAAAAAGAAAVAAAGRGWEASPARDVASVSLPRCAAPAGLAKLLEPGVAVLCSGTEIRAREKPSITEDDTYRVHRCGCHRRYPWRYHHSGLLLPLSSSCSSPPPPPPPPSPPPPPPAGESHLICRRMGQNRVPRRLPLLKHPRWLRRRRRQALRSRSPLCRHDGPGDGDGFICHQGAVLQG